MKISIIIPVYNRAALIAETLKSLLQQTIPADEIIVVDDGSTDGTANATREAFAEWESEKEKGKKSPDFKLLAQENSGPGAARNLGLKEARGEFIHFFDSDDIALPNKHEVQLKALQESGADIAYGPWVVGRFVNTRNELNPQWKNNTTFIPDGHVLQQHGLPHGDLVKALLTNWSIVPHACLFRKKILELVGGFPEEIYVAEDQLMFLRCLLNGAKVVHSPGTLELYRLGTNNKLTMKGDVTARENIDYGRFLSAARKECLAHGIEPSKWFEFRLRAWESVKALENSGLTPTPLSAELKIDYQRNPDFIFRIAKTILARWSGVKERFGLPRSGVSFRAEKLSDLQRDMIAAMGY